MEKQIASMCTIHCTPYTVHSTWIAWKVKEIGEKLRKMWLSMSLFLCSICQNSIACHVFSVRCPCIGNMVQVLNMYELCTCFWVFSSFMECKMHIANLLFVMNVISVVEHIRIFSFSLNWNNAMLKSLKLKQSFVRK